MTHHARSTGGPEELSVHVFTVHSDSLFHCLPVTEGVDPEGVRLTNDGNVITDLDEVFTKKGYKQAFGKDAPVVQRRRRSAVMKDQPWRDAVIPIEFDHSWGEFENTSH